MTDTQPAPTTTDAGIPIESDEHSLTIGPDGPILLHDHYLIEQMAAFNRERVPERQPHAKGSGAFGRFEVTQDVSAYTKAAVFQPGTTTETVIRFSTVAGERGSPDTWRDPRGFALKFYTTEGNYDIVGNDTPVFFLRDPLKFGHFIRSQKRRADSNLRDHDMQWDFWTLSPETAHQVTWLFGDRGIPRSWRHMNLYSGHTFMWVNAAGEKVWVRYHFITDQGIENLTQAEADELVKLDTDYHTRDLFEAIARGELPVVDAEDADHAVRGRQDLPVQPVRSDQGVAARRLSAHRGRPADAGPQPHRPPQPDRAGRVGAQQPGARHRREPGQDAAGPDVRLPRRAPLPHRRELQPATGQRTQVAGAQLQHRRPHALPAGHRPGVRAELQGRTPAPTPNATASPPAGTPTATWCAPPTRLRAEDDDWGQAGTLVRDVMNDAERDRLVDNIVGHLLNGVTEPVLQRAFDYWRNVDKDLGDRIEKGVRAR